MSAIQKFLMEHPFLFRMVAPFHRYRLARSFYTPKLRMIRKWIFRSRETTNFTYHLQPMNLEYLASFVSEVTGRGYEEIAGHMAELEGDVVLKELISKRVCEEPLYRMRSDTEARYSRRLGWYAVARALKPKVVVETGVDKGLGSLVLTAALRKNALEGHPGRYYGTDINPKAGFLFIPPYTEFGEILFGDSCDSLSRLDGKIDLFVNDSDHSLEYERREYEVVGPKLTENAIVLGDNSHETDALFQFARKTGRRFLFFQEWPKDHWFPGGGIGAAFRR